MGFKNKYLAAAALIALAGGMVVAGATVPANAATPSCGVGCVDVFSQQFGTHLTPNYAVDTFRQGEKAGQPVILFRTANFDPALDFTVSFQGTVGDFFAAGLVSSAVNLHYGCNYDPAVKACGDTAFPNDFAFEDEYSPFGVESGLCVAVAVTAFQGEGVTLEPCGVSSRSVWIVDQADASSLNASLAEYVPLINGSDTNFSQPFVLTYPANGVPTDKPRPQLTVTNLTGFSTGALSDPQGVSSLQMWGAVFGTLK